MTLPLSLPVRTFRGFERTKCACEFCQAFCHHLPGLIIPDDLERLMQASNPDHLEIMQWAELHLRVNIIHVHKLGKIKVLVPKESNPFGRCHWLTPHTNSCEVHDAAPFGCAFFDCTQSSVEAMKRSNAATKHIREELRKPNSLYFQVVKHLIMRKLYANVSPIAEVMLRLRLDMIEFTR